MTEQYTPDSYTGKLNSLFKNSNHHNNSTSLNVTKITSETSFTTQSSQLAVDEPSTNLTASHFPTIAADDEHLSSLESVSSAPADQTTEFLTTKQPAKQFFSALTLQVKVSSSVGEGATDNLSDEAKYAFPPLPSQSSNVSSSEYNTTIEYGESPCNSTAETANDIVNVDNTSSATEMQSPDLYVYYTFILCILACIGILGNSTVIHLIMKECQLRVKVHCTNMAILSLTVADIFTCVLVAFPASVSLANGKDPTKGVLCRLQSTAFYVTTTITLGTMTIISFDRFCAIRWPLHYHKWITQAQMGIALIATWIQALTVCISWVSQENNKVAYEDPWRILCVAIWNTSTDLFSFEILSLVWFIIFPIVMTVFFNGSLLMLVFLGENESSSPAVTCTRQNALRRGRVIPSLNENELSNTHFCHNAVCAEPPKSVTTWAKVNTKFHWRRSVNAQDLDGDVKNIQLFTRVGESFLNSNENISRILVNERIRNVETTNDQVLKSYLAIIIIFLTLEFPSAIIFTIKHTLPSQKQYKIDGGFFFFAFVCRIVACTVNPFLLAAFRNDFRNAFNCFFKTLPLLGKLF